ncbi:hypothetical protein GCM10023195_73480 [Actinoallomurus liliacearum]|uniref:Uncharacterized protein n=1 Tax=Actinoallomurus liliacearum TaxID=1080073 RepID=A0ABP8TWN5_9ACTN
MPAMVRGAAGPAAAASASKKRKRLGHARVAPGSAGADMEQAATRTTAQRDLITAASVA